MVEKWKIVVAPIAEKRIFKIPNPDKRRMLTTINELHNLHVEQPPSSGMILNATQKY